MKARTLRLAYSPCPNDTFIFGALALGLIPTPGFRFEIQLADIRELNELAKTGQVDVCKVSFYAYTQLHTLSWQLLETGSALGRGCGPLVVTKPDFEHRKTLRTARIAVPGLDTTACFLLRYYEPQVQHLEVVPFNEIMPAVAEGRFDAGVIIHESRFVYPQFGLNPLVDLGEHWETRTGYPIPLGGIVARQSAALTLPDIAAVDTALAHSLAFARKHPDHPALKAYIAEHAQEMSPEVCQAHIRLYVNEYTDALGPEGHAAVRAFCEIVEKTSMVS
jgi:1,4-dihydroxy-6-naphthoate synthase